MQPYLSNDSIILLHDVDAFLLHRGVAMIVRQNPEKQYHYMRMRSVHFKNAIGTGLLVPGKQVLAFCDLAAEPGWSAYLRSIVNLNEDTGPSNTQRLMLNLQVNNRFKAYS
eukprot:gnl/MRDRNA2_/MRDRNA2_450029_c0_seq1.p1 gnl/MRDRNA2_/MRDRNA2_450029_c0~~gnl/MRDRNA2_/MRDRNA2_450029_c0_seq1.p1  ORF type:complete len:120 (+),score=10.23 gnl/MRDRNA2_/MRDRNA2_450029_c0_seq1:28-360(+)